MRTATARYTQTGCEISSFYDEAFLHDLKSEIPHFARVWDKERKVWVVRDSYVMVALEIAKRYFRVVELNKREEHQRHTHSDHHTRSDSAHSVLHLLPSAPKELIKSAYRTLALLYHPDHGGNQEKMQKINAAYEKLTK